MSQEERRMVEDGDILKMPLPLPQLPCADVITGKLEVGAPGCVISLSSRGIILFMAHRHRNVIGTNHFARKTVSVIIE